MTTSTRAKLRTPGLVLALVVHAACGPHDGAGTHAPDGEDSRYAVAVAHPSRPAEDIERDPIRKPAQFLALAGIQPGQRVLELGSGFGYMVTLLAAVVGPQGTVVAHNPPNWAAFPAPEWAQGRARAFAEGTIVEHVAPWDDPVPRDAPPFDVVLSSFAYHEVLIAGADAGAMNAAVLGALRPGGRYVVADLHAAPGTSEAECIRLHRIDAARVRAQVEAAGFVLISQSDIYENRDDDRSQPTCCDKLPSDQDRFVFVFQRPE